MSLDKKEINLDINKTQLLNELANDIAKEFWVKKEKAKQLIKSETINWIDWLKKQLNFNENSETKLDNKELEKLFFTLKWANEVIEKSSKLEIRKLKSDIEKSINIEEFKNQIDEYLPSKLISAAKNPQKPHEQILGLALWSANSIYKTVDILYKIWKWVVSTPYHIYMIITWKWESNSFKNI